MKKGISIGIIFLFIVTTIAPSTGIIVFNDDTTPPVSNHSIDPATPDGDNGWYASDVEVTLDAMDDISGVKEIRYRIDGGSWKAIPGHHGTFLIDEDGDNILIEYYAVDNVGNEEDINSFTIDMDQIIPDIDDVEWEFFIENCTLYLKFTCNAVDETSGMDRVEMYICDGNYETIEGSGPTYEFTPIQWSYNAFKMVVFGFYHYDKAGNKESDFIDGGGGPPHQSITGIVLNPKISDQNVTFFAMIVRWKYYDGWDVSERRTYIIEHLTLPNDYTGYIGRFFICANFYDFQS
jgi:hypothetical protein